MAASAIEQTAQDSNTDMSTMHVLCLMPYQTLTKAEGLLSQGLDAMCEMSLLEDEFDDLIDRPTSEIHSLIEKFRFARELNQTAEQPVQIDQ